MMYHDEVPGGVILNTPAFIFRVPFSSLHEEGTQKEKDEEFSEDLHGEGTGGG